MEEFEIYRLKQRQNYIILIVFMVLMIMVNIFSYIYIDYNYGMLNTTHTRTTATIIDSGAEGITYRYVINENEVYQKTTKEISGKVGAGVTIYYNNTNVTMVKYRATNNEYLLILLSIFTEVIVLIDFLFVILFYRY